MTHDLYEMTDEQRNALFKNTAINDAVATKIAGWKFEVVQDKADRPWFPHGPGHRVWYHESLGAAGNAYAESPSFVSSADAVMPLLDGRAWSLSRRGEWYWVRIDLGLEINAVGSAMAFPMAACIALLRTINVEVEI